MKVKRLLFKILPILAGLAAIPASAQLTFTGCPDKAVSEKPEAATGIETLYVLSNTDGVTATYKATTGAKVTWSRYSNLGGGYAEEIPTVKDGDKYSINLTTSDMGYIIDEGTARHCYWVVNYANHEARFESLGISDEQECDRARLEFNGKADPITFYTINGAGRTLDRDIRVTYRTLKYDPSSQVYTETPAERAFASLDHSIGVQAPLCDTHFTLTGDRFLKVWGRELTIESGNYQAIAVEAETSATQTVRENDNEQKIDANLGGSGPVEVTFTAAVTDAAIFREWQMSTDPEFETIIDRFQQTEFTYNFRENGNTYVRLVANNASGTCEFVGESYEVFVGESDLQCPNVFSPNGDGVNDEWKVSYKSIVEFECHIFNRWGQEVCTFKDPALGWDGRHNGKIVPTGAYYYVIVARGSDGRKYKLSGDINIIRSKTNQFAGEADQ